MAIRTYNGEKHLAEILDALRIQVGLEDVNWEVLVVDNCSTDNTADIIRRYQIQWPAENPLRYCFESVQGADVARKRAIREANAPLIGFLDDDNVPTAGWIRAALDFAQSHPDVAAFGGKIYGRLEGAPPQNFERIAGFLPIVEREHAVCFTRGAYDRINMLPPGAGLVIRRQVWLACVPPTLNLRGPVRQSLSLKGEDIEALMYIKRAGWHIWYTPDMAIYHHISQQRLERGYLLQFFKGIGNGRYYTRMAGRASWQKPLLAVAYAMNDLRKLTRHWLRHHRKFASDVVLAGEFQLYCSSFLSPFLCLQQALRLKLPRLNALPMGHFRQPVKVSSRLIQ